MKIPETEGTVHLSPAAGKPKQEEESDYVALPLQNQYDSIFIIHTHAAGREWILAWFEIKGTWGRRKAAILSVYSQTDRVLERLFRFRIIKIEAVGVRSDCRGFTLNLASPRWIPGSDFHMQAQVFTEKVSCQGLFWKEK